MEVEIKITKNLENPKAIIQTPQITEEVQNAVDFLSQTASIKLLGFAENNIYILKPEEILRIYSQEKKIYAQTLKLHVELKNRLYELDENILSNNFVRISHSEIVNFDFVENLDLSLTGTITLYLKNQERTFVSRRYIAKIKNYLKLN